MTALSCAILAGCTGAGGGHGAAAPAPSHPPASGPHARGQGDARGPSGSAGNPLVLHCADEAWPFPPASPRGRADLVIGPLDIVNGKALSGYTPASYGYSSYGHDSGRFYKVAVVVTVGATVTQTIAPPARGHVVIDLPGGGVTSVTYHSCARQAGGFFAQGFAFTHRPVRGCVPLNVTIGNRPPVHHLTLSLFAGPCVTGPAAETAASS